ncbi:MAG: heavy metal translocating P-type ATPase metal-binding domain-containing protein [Chitinophagales bacterium]|nr:heavy metal translocating P-type ATPase metal-binding domain-containing protein [Chitinophagales bacterium]MBP8752805.1 heavy metal translocating P-type ATPase metal-binding domain-containing protein [Chitinophagales bacterium]MBP9189497.1 heavy metal translocating P-type ATPase metal-binding domain-containing protein [Chitinophagales bacterium]MBP9703250.1 heavy metal translocating P-type ATPase metal-binding domain-containing protein [Chitinophagales bacterium]
MGSSIENKLLCFHCGEPCPDATFTIEEKTFCCFGCKTVYEILQDNDLCAYYDIQNFPGQSQKNKIASAKYEVLDRPDIKRRYITFSDGKQIHVKFYLPLIHCSSCIWLLENLHAINPGIIQSTVDFTRKEIFIIADETVIALKDIAAVLDSVGYEPYLSYSDMGEKKIAITNGNRLLRIGIAGFCFGNIMMFSIPEYFAGGDLQDLQLQRLFHFLSFILSLPVLFYCSQEFFNSAWKGLRNRFLNIDAPIVLAILITFIRSMYAILIEQQGGYFDSMSGIVFFMLVGRFFQDYTYRSITFDRDYKSYFPLAVSKLSKGVTTQIPLSELQNGDDYLVHHGELIPADSVLINGIAQIDYSFVTGESEPVEKTIGDLIYAGGRQTGGQLELCVIKDVSQSYLTQLWNNTGAQKEVNESGSFVHLLSKYFSYIVITLSVTACIFWMFVDSSRALDALVTPLIIACPCALLLSSTFTYGNAITRLGRFGFYLKNAHVIERLQHITTIVFDKTGTITKNKSAEVIYEGELLSEEMQSILFSLASHSTHPYSRSIVRYLGKQHKIIISDFTESAGAGIAGIYDSDFFQIGSAKFTGASHDNLSAAYCAINGNVIGRFIFKNKYVDGLEEMITDLKTRYHIYLVSGDNAREHHALSEIFGNDNQLYNCSPHEKKNFVQQLQSKGEKVAMIGDGLNDAGALLASDAGIAISSDINQFTPASDAILDIRFLQKLPELFKYARQSRHVILGSFIFSILYNLVGLFFALQGLLSPVIAAILMPLSTITIVLFTTGLSSILAKSKFK